VAEQKLTACIEEAEQEAGYLESVLDNLSRAQTDSEITAIKNGRTYINFYPVTGRTHQLRVHSAHQMGLNTPIVGDLLYGKAEQRLMLHAHWVEFQHPLKGDFKIVSPLPDGFSL
jgi:23S rRNA-/tRNA-specific pseudouridylate synthase